MEIKNRVQFIKAFRKMMKRRKPSDHFLNVLLNSKESIDFGHALLVFTVLEPEVGRYFFNQIQRQAWRRQNLPKDEGPIEQLNDLDNTDPMWMRKLLKAYGDVED